MRGVSQAVTFGVVAAVALTAAWWLGGWAWALLCIVALAALRRAEASVPETLAALGLSFFWLGLYAATGDRRMFFPYAMQLAVQIPYALAGRIRWAFAAGGMLGLFLLIRVAQAATGKVLLVELAVSIAIPAIVRLAFGERAPETGRRMMAGALGSVLALAGLLL